MNFFSWGLQWEFTFLSANRPSGFYGPGCRKSGLVVREGISSSEQSRHPGWGRKSKVNISFNCQLPESWVKPESGIEGEDQSQGQLPNARPKGQAGVGARTGQ